jgi:NAD(P)-dependent dehydrogenase (short-subunit alcohol dehydrogenase family)
MLQDKIIIVTGGAGLLGQEFIRTIVKNQGVAIIADIDESLGRKIKTEISSEFDTNRVDFISLDITSEESVAECITKVINLYSKIDALVNNAYPRNKSYGNHFFDVRHADFIENVNLSLGGYFLCSQKFSEFFIRQGFVNIVNISSVYGMIAPKFEIYNNTELTMPVEYAVIKSGLIHLTKYMAKYLKGKGIRVNSLSPGGILDGQPKDFVAAYNMNCMNKGMLDKHDLNGALLFLLSDMSLYLNGQNLIVDDGFTL